MRSRTLGVAVAALVSFVAASPAPAATKTTEVLQQFVVSGKGAEPKPSPARVTTCARRRRQAARHLIVATPSQAAKLLSKDVTVRPLAGKQTNAKVAPPNPLQDPDGYDVFRPWNLTPAPCPTACSTPLIPMRKWYLQKASANTDIVERVPYGESRLGQQLAAFRVTKSAGQHRQGSKPMVLYHATEHAREWIAVETNRSLFDYVLAHKNDPGPPAFRRSSTRTELWFTPVVNPDGYDYTFVSDASRL